MKTALIPPLEASVSISKGIEKLGIAKTRAVVKVCFNALKASVARLLHSKTPFIKRLVSVLLIISYPLINFLQYLESLRKLLNSLTDLGSGHWDTASTFFGLVSSPFAEMRLRYSILDI